MRKVYIDSFSHYQLKAEKGPGRSIFLIEFTTEDDHDPNACPGMGDREEFLPSEGKTIETFSEGEEVEFIYSSYTWTVNKDQTSDKVVCGDDLRYLFKETE